MSDVRLFPTLTKCIVHAILATLKKVRSVRENKGEVLLMGKAKMRGAYNSLGLSGLDCAVRRD